MFCNSTQYWRKLGMPHRLMLSMKVANELQSFARYFCVILFMHVGLAHYMIPKWLTVPTNIQLQKSLAVSENLFYSVACNIYLSMQGFPNTHVATPILKSVLSRVYTLVLLYEVAFHNELSVIYKMFHLTSCAVTCSHLQSNLIFMIKYCMPSTICVLYTLPPPLTTEEAVMVKRVTKIVSRKKFTAFLVGVATVVRRSTT